MTDSSDSSSSTPSHKEFKGIMADLNNLVENCTKEELEMKLIQFCHDGNRDAVEFLLLHGVDTNASDKDGQTPLMIASMHGYEEVVALLLTRVDNVDVESNADMTALMYSSAHGHKKTAELLIRAGADVNSGNDCDEKMPVICACQSGFEEMAQFLIEQGADEFVAMLYACQYGCESVVQCLIDRGEDPENVHLYSKSALMIACEHGRENVIKLLISRGANVNRCIDDMHTALSVACSSGHDKIVELLLDHGAQLDTDSYWKPPNLMLACDKSQVNVIKVLLERGADPNKCDADRFASPLMWAAKDGCVEGVSMLLARGADVHARDRHNQTALHFASGHANVDTLDLLIENGADVNAMDRQGMRPLHNAAWYGRVENMEVLIKHGACVNEKVAEVMTPLSSASEHGLEEAVRFLLEHGAEVKSSEGFCEPSLIVASENGHEAIVELLMEWGADINGQYVDEETTALMCACQKGEDKIVELLIKNGADMNLVDESGQTALMRACRKVDYYSDQCGRDGCKGGCAKCVEILLHNGVDVNVQCSDRGMSAVMVAVEDNHATCLQALLPVHPNLELKDNESCTVFSHAMRTKYTECLKILLQDGILMKDGNLKPEHKITSDTKCSPEALLVTIDYGIFEWQWCPPEHFLTMSLAALKSGFCPGFVRFDNFNMTPLIFAIVKNDSEAVETFLQHRYFFPEDYQKLTQDNAMSVRNLIKSEHDPLILDRMFVQPLSLLSWSFVTASKILSISGRPGSRRDRIDTLPIPDKVKKLLKFEIE